MNDFLKALKVNETEEVEPIEEIYEKDRETRRRRRKFRVIKAKARLNTLKNKGSRLKVDIENLILGQFSNGSEELAKHLTGGESRKTKIKNKGYKHKGGFGKAKQLNVKDQKSIDKLMEEEVDE